jgi:hypothetical protein
MPIWYDLEREDFLRRVGGAEIHTDESYMRMLG